MAQVVAGPAGFDMTQLDLTALVDGAVLTRTASTYALDLGGGQVVTFTGNFAYGAQNFPTDGAITGISETVSGQGLFNITGLSVPASTFLAWANNGQTLQGIQTMFAGADSLTASNNPSGNILGGFGGDDVLVGGSFGDVLDGGVGSNTLIGNDGNDTLGAPDSHDFNYIRGGAGSDAIFGGAGRDDVNGNQGEDTITGGEGGDDWLLGGQGNDQVTATAGNVIINGNLGTDTVTGGSGNDWVRGGQGDDIVRGGAGDDNLYPDRGNDTVTGGSGADVFHLQAFGGADRITDFNGTEGDRIQLDPGSTYTLAQSGADTVLTLGSGDSMTLVGVARTSIAADWIIIA